MDALLANEAKEGTYFGCYSRFLSILLSKDISRTNLSIKHRIFALKLIDTFLTIITVDSMLSAAFSLRSFSDLGDIVPLAQILLSHHCGFPILLTKYIFCCLRECPIA